MIYENMREEMALNYGKDDGFIALTEGKTSHIVTSHDGCFFLGGGGVLENMFTRERMFLGTFSFSIQSLNDKIVSLR